MLIGQLPAIQYPSGFRRHAARAVHRGRKCIMRCCRRYRGWDGLRWCPAAPSLAETRVSSMERVSNLAGNPTIGLLLLLVSVFLSGVHGQTSFQS